MATIILKHSTVKDKLPSSAQFGEVFVNYHNENPFLATLNNQGQFEKFISENKTKELFYTKSQVNDIIANLESGCTIDFDDYYKKNEVDTLLQGKSDTGHIHDYSQILNTPDLSNFATLSDIPSINGLASEVWVGENYQPKGNYLTEHQSLENYYTKSEADNKFLTSHQDLSGYALKAEIPDVSNFVTSAFTDATYAKKGDVPTDVYTKSETDTLLAGKASSSHTHDYSEILNTPDVPKIWKGTLSEYTNLTDIDSDTLYVITDESEQFTTSGEVESMISGFTTLSEVQVELEGYSQTGHTHSQYLTQTSADSRYARVVSCTQAEYDALVQNDQVEQGVLYCISEGSQSSSEDSGNSGNTGYIPDNPNPIIPDPDDLNPDPDPNPFDF